MLAGPKHPDSSDRTVASLYSPGTLLSPHTTSSPTSPGPSVSSPHTDLFPYPRCCSVLTCAIPAKLKSPQQSTESHPQGPKARWGALDKGFLTPFCSVPHCSLPASLMLGRGLPATTSGVKHPQIKQFAQQCGVGVSWGDRATYDFILFPLLQEGTIK